MSNFAINTVIEIGRLTKDPELRSISDETSVCKMRLAVDGMGRGGETGYIDVDVFGAPAENCMKYLGKGHLVAVKGRLQWREWQPEVGSTRQAHSIVADSVQFLGAPRGEGSDEPAQPEAEPVAA
jgi:single-strand DNA-binding protein